MAAQHDFIKLSIWIKGIEIIKDMYVTIKTFPKPEIHYLPNQMQDSPVSIPSNIAEGKSKSSTEHCINCLDIALGPAFEINYISEHTFKYLEKK